MKPTLKLATFNINNIVRRLPVLLRWLDEVSPDIVCLQELKAADGNFPAAALQELGYTGSWVGQVAWNGVAILAKGGAPVEVRRALPGDPSDAQSRYIEAAVRGILVGCLYLPNGNPQPGPKFEYKRTWFERLSTHAQTLYDSGHPVVLAGDYNVVPTDADIYDTRSWRKNALLQPGPRAQYQRLLARLSPRPTPDRTHLHVLGLLPRSLVAQRRAASRPHPPKREACPETRGLRGGQLGTWAAGRERSRAGVGDTRVRCSNQRAQSACAREGAAGLVSQGRRRVFRRDIIASSR